MAYEIDISSAINSQNLVGETIVLSELSCSGLVKSTLSSGVLKLAQAKGNAAVLLSTVKDCNVIAVTRQRDFRFYKARFINCRFHGVYSGIDFGRADNTELYGDFGAVENCDFTEATLDGCRFFNVDIASSKLPGWPHFLLPDLRGRVAEIDATEWPGNLGKYLKISRPASVTAEVANIPMLANLVRCTEEEVIDALNKFGGVLS